MNKHTSMGREVVHTPLVQDRLLRSVPFITLCPKGRMPSCGGWILSAACPSCLSWIIRLLKNSLRGEKSSQFPVSLILRQLREGLAFPVPGQAKYSPARWLAEDQEHSSGSGTKSGDFSRSLSCLEPQVLLFTEKKVMMKKKKKI